MIKVKSHLETKTDSATHTYFTDNNTPVTEVIEALKTFLTYSYGLLKQGEEQQKGSTDGESKPESGCCS